jgi:hypothetical protein
MTHQQEAQERDFPMMCALPLGNKSLLAVFVVQKVAQIKKKAAQRTELRVYLLFFLFFSSCGNILACTKMTSPELNVALIQTILEECKNLSKVPVDKQQEYHQLLQDQGFAFIFFQGNKNSLFHRPCLFPTSFSVL